MSGLCCLRPGAGALCLLAATLCGLALGVRDSSAHRGFEALDAFEESTTTPLVTSTESAVSFVAEFDMNIPRTHHRPNDTTAPTATEQADTSSPTPSPTSSVESGPEDEDAGTMSTTVSSAEDRLAEADTSSPTPSPTSSVESGPEDEDAGTMSTSVSSAEDRLAEADTSSPTSSVESESEDEDAGTISKTVSSAEDRLAELVDCTVVGESTPAEVLGKLKGCTHSLDKFAHAVKDQHGRSRDANERYVETLGQVAERLQGIRDMKELDGAFTNDQGKALKVLMAEADKVQESIESMTPAAAAAAA